jgi:hypothetical protein
VPYSRLSQAEEAEDDKHHDHDTDNVEDATHGVFSFPSRIRTTVEPEPLPANGPIWIVFAYKWLRCPFNLDRLFAEVSNICAVEARMSRGAVRQRYLGA